METKRVKRGKPMTRQTKTAHVAAIITVFIWATTFVSTKILLIDFQPIEILFFRFVMGFVALVLIYPRRLKVGDIKREVYFILAGLFGVCLYFLLENIALTYTQASNVGVIISVAPFFTAILTRWLMKGDEKLSLQFFIGFLIAITGITLISFGGNSLQVNPLGDLLSLFAAIAWAFYSVLTRKIASFGYNTIQTTRRVFAYGILLMIPTLFYFDFSLDFTRFAKPESLFNILYLGLGASAACFVTWGFAVRVLGAVKTSVYIYLVPVVTVITSVIILHEKLTVWGMIGIALTLLGLMISERKFSKKEG